MIRTTVVFLLLFLGVLGRSVIPRSHLFQGALNYGRSLNEIEANSLDNELWFRHQRVDHFTPGDMRTFAQRFYMNDTYWKPGSGQPIFLMLGGEGPISPTDVEGHFAFSDQASMFGALVLDLEHRFYGKTQPFSKTTTENLRYLTSEQALADAAVFIEWFSNEFKAQDSKWIVWGGSYSGSLAAWMRLKYPTQVIGAIASSAPVMPQLDFVKYLETVAMSIGSTCSNQFQQASQKIESLLKSESGRSQLVEDFKLCDPIVTLKDAQTFYESIVGAVAGIVQYNNDNNDYEAMNISKMCSIMTNSSFTDPLDAWVSFNNEINSFNKVPCTQSSYTKTVELLSATQTIDTAARSWTWQTCTEFGYFQTGESSNQPFSSSLLPLDYFVDMCEDIYGVRMTPNINWTKTLFGSTRLAATRVALANGSVDPWHNLGIISNASNPTLVPLFMNGTAHCADLYPPRPSDLPALTQTRHTQMQLVTRWLNYSM